MKNTRVFNYWYPNEIKLFFENPDEDTIALIFYELNEDFFRRNLEFPSWIQKIYIIPRYTRGAEKIKENIENEWTKIPFGCEIEFSKSRSRQGIIYRNTVTFDDDIFETEIVSSIHLFTYDKITNTLMNINIECLAFEMNFDYQGMNIQDIIDCCKNYQLDARKYVGKIKMTGQMLFSICYPYLKKHYNSNLEQTFLENENEFKENILIIKSMTLEKFSNLDFDKVYDLLNNLLTDTVLISE